MELLTPQQIWKGYDPSALPLCASILADREAEGRRVVTAYFNGPTTTDGVVRVFVRCTLPAGKGRYPAVVFMPDVGHSAEADVEWLADKGYAVIVPDYAGVRDDSPEYTIYPRSLSAANYTPERLSEYPGDMRFNCWSVWAEVGMRTLSYAASLDFVDGTRLAVMGEGVASAAALKAAALDKRLSCAITLYSSGMCEERSDDPNFLMYKVALADAAYAPMVNVPLLMMIASNDADGKADEMSAVYSLIPEQSGSRLSVSERTNRAIGVKQRADVGLWLDKYLLGRGEVPAEPELTASASERRLYYNVKSDPSCETELFVSRGTDDPALRNWSRIKLMVVGDGEYIAPVDVYDAKKHIYAFVNSRSSEGLSVSSPVLEKLPALLGIDETPLTDSRLIYDGDMGTDDWSEEASMTAADTLSVKEGPFGISGVTSGAGALATYKLGDPAFSGKEGYLLQIMIYSPEAQTVTFTVAAAAAGRGYAEFSRSVNLEPGDNWRKLTLEASDFKSPYGVCGGWEDVFGMRIMSASPVIVASMLWV